MVNKDNIAKTQEKTVKKLTGTQRILSCIIFLVLITCTLWYSTGYRVSKMELSMTGVSDEDGFIRPNDTKVLRQYAASFAAKYGFNIHITIQKKSLQQLPPPPPATLRLAICPPLQQARIDIPAFARPLLGEELASRLQKDYFIPYFANARWQQGLNDALNAITRQLDSTIVHANAMQNRRTNSTPVSP